MEIRPTGFYHQTHEYTITTDPYNWVLIWHPDGPVYQADRDGMPAPLPRGHRSYFSRLHHLTSRLIDLKAKHCSGFEEINASLSGFVEEMKKINGLELAKAEAIHALNVKNSMSH